MTFRFNKLNMSCIVFSDMGSFSAVNMNYWFNGPSSVTSFSRIGNLANVREMQYTFSNCTAVSSLDFRWFDPSGLTSLFLTFGRCSNLEAIYADSSWALLASGLSRAQTFYNCTSLVGGNGTAHSSANTGYAYMRVDAYGQAGYLTAA